MKAPVYTPSIYHQYISSVGIDLYGFFRADTDFISSALADDPYSDTYFFEPIFGADTAFAPSISIIKITLFKKGTFSELSVNHAGKRNILIKKSSDADTRKKRKYRPSISHRSLIISIYIFRAVV